MLIKHILETKPSQKVMTIAKDSSIEDAVSLLSEYKIGVLVVSENGVNVDGILSERDLVRELGKRGQSVLSETVKNLMTAKLKTCGKDDSAETVLKAMTDGRFRHMPVMDGDKMIGLVSIGDVVKARLNEIERENSQMVEMIRG